MLRRAKSEAVSPETVPVVPRHVAIVFETALETYAMRQRRYGCVPPVVSGAHA